MSSSEDLAAMPPLKKTLSTLMAFWLLPTVPVVAWIMGHDDGLGAVVFLVVLLYLATGVVIGLPLLIVGLFTRRR